MLTAVVTQSGEAFTVHITADTVPPNTTYVPVSTNSVVGVTLPVSRPEVAVTTLNAEPGVYRPCVGRLRSGASGSVLRRAHCSSRLAGSYVGAEAEAGGFAAAGSEQSG